MANRPLVAAFYIRVVDGRNDFYQAPVMKDFDAIDDVTRDWETVMDKYHVGWTILPVTHPLNRILELEIVNAGLLNPLTINVGTNFSGADAASFKLLTILPVTINPGASTNLQVQFDPAGTIGFQEAMLNIASNDPGLTTLDLRVVRTGSDYSFEFRADDTQPWTVVTVYNTGTTPTHAGIFGKTWDPNVGLVVDVGRKIGARRGLIHPLTQPFRLGQYLVEGHGSIPDGTEFGCVRAANLNVAAP